MACRTSTSSWVPPPRSLRKLFAQRCGHAILRSLTGNDPEQDSDREPEPPTKAIEKTLPRSGKRSGPEPTKEPRTGAGNARKEVGGNEGGT